LRQRQGWRSRKSGIGGRAEQTPLTGSTPPLGAHLPERRVERDGSGEHLFGQGAGMAKDEPGIR
jgi:hypothetical protein